MVKRRKPHGTGSFQYDGIKFRSRAEAARYETLKNLASDERIKLLRVFPEQPHLINGDVAWVYVPSFSYLDMRCSPPRLVVEDVRSQPICDDPAQDPKVIAYNLTHTNPVKLTPLSGQYFNEDKNRRMRRSRRLKRLNKNEEMKRQAMEEAKMELGLESMCGAAV